MQGQIAPRQIAGVSSSSLSKDFKNFVFFSPETRGALGRPVKIDPQLFAPFLSLVDPATYAGSQVIRTLVNLRASARHLNSQANAFNSFEYLITTGNVAVRYRVCSEGSDDKGTVYITKVNSNYSSSAKSGFYTVSEAGRLAIKEHENTKFGHHTAYINGSSQDGSASFQQIAQDAIDNTSAGGCLLVYSSGSVINDLGIWKASPQSGWQKKLMVDRLKEALELNAGDKKEWIAEGEGASLLMEAISQATGNPRKDLSYEKYQFSNYQFKILNPVGDTTKLLSLLRQKKANLAEKTLTYDKPGRSAKISALSQFSQITQRLSTLGSRSEFNQAITGRFKQAMGGKVGDYRANSVGTSSSNSTFSEAITRASKILK